ncbi:MAG TPA: MFS transporter [Vicinamibacterales bacterium]|nr:MFS transporter [Vicinamibacterales bacterium]
MFVALQHRNFRLLWGGLLVSFSGSFMQAAAILWHVSLLVPDDRRALALGMVGLVRIVPVIVFSLISGVAADAFDRRRLMLLTQSVMAVLAAVLALLTYRGLTTVWPIYLLAACSSAAGAFDLPARQALAPTLVPREHLPNAISLNTIMVQIASVAGPALGGAIIASAGVAWAYAFNAVSYLVVIAALLMMRIKPAAGSNPTEIQRGDFTMKAALEGLRFVFRSPLIRSTMLLDFFATFFSSATALLPIFAQDVLGVGARGYGWLYAAPAAGACIASAIMVRAVERIERRGIVLVGAVLTYGLATAAFGVSRIFWLTFGCLAVTGAADTVSMVFRNLIRQLETPDHLRGRMTGVNMVFFMGGPQLGELEAGLVANWLGPVVSVVSGGIGCLIATGWVAAVTPPLRAYRRTAQPEVPVEDLSTQARTGKTA